MHEKSSLSILLPFIKQLTFWRGKNDENLLHFLSPPASSVVGGKEKEKEDLPGEEMRAQGDYSRLITLTLPLLSLGKTNSRNLS